MICNDLRQIFPLKHKSRIFSGKVTSPINVHDDHSSIDNSESMSLTRLGRSIDGDDVESCSERDVEICEDGTVGRCEVSFCEGAGSNVGSDPSSSLRRPRQPKHKRQQQQRRSTSCLVAGQSPPSGLDPTEPPARVVDPLECSYIHGTPDPIPSYHEESTTINRCVPEICNQDNQNSNNKRATMNDIDGDNDDDDDEQHTSSSPSALHAATGPLGRPRSTPVRRGRDSPNPITKTR